MNDFWSRRLNLPVHQSTPPAPPQSTAWWAQTPVLAAPTAPVATSPATIADALADTSPTTTKARSARSQEFCPDCGSGNYFRPDGHANAMAQCYECGYNPRFSHTTAGVGIPSDAGAAVPAKQLNPKGVGNFNPQEVFAHI